MMNLLTFALLFFGFFGHAAELTLSKTMLVSNPLKPFTTDGCSLFPDGDFDRDRWLICCKLHDVKYWLDGTVQERQQADLELGICVKDKAYGFLGGAMYKGVRIGGTSQVRSGWHWGYGWTHKRDDNPLSAPEKNASEELYGPDLIDLTEQLDQYPVQSRGETSAIQPLPRKNHCLTDTLSKLKAAILIDSTATTFYEIQTQNELIIGIKLNTCIGHVRFHFDPAISHESCFLDEYLNLSSPIAKISATLGCERIISKGKE